jgi:uncharacterized protein DUF4255
MATFEAIGAVGKSLERLLSAGFADPPAPASGAKAVLVRSDDLKDGAGFFAPPALTIFLHRVAPNTVMRSAWSGVGSVDGVSHTPLDLHYLFTPWGTDAESEHRILGRAIQIMETTPILSGPLLYPSATWAPNETVQVVLEEIGTESIMRVFDKLTTDYRPSVSYVARVARLDGRVPAPLSEVTTAIRGVRPSVTPLSGGAP